MRSPMLRSPTCVVMLFLSLPRARAPTSTGLTPKQLRTLHEQFVRHESAAALDSDADTLTGGLDPAPNPAPSTPSRGSVTGAGSHNGDSDMGKEPPSSLCVGQMCVCVGGGPRRLYVHTACG